MQVTIGINLPEGWQATGEYRAAKSMEGYLDSDQTSSPLALTASYDHTYSSIILEKKRWRAEKNDLYWFIYLHALGADINSRPDYLVTDDTYHYDTGNYYQDRQAAEEACKRIQEIFNENI